MTEPAALVELQHVNKKFGDFVALDNINLTINQGEFFSVLGPSGCGKSTMLRLIAGLEFSDSGSLFIDGKNMDAVPAYRRPCNMVFQNYAIFPHLTVTENVAYGLRGEGLQKSELRERVQEMLAAVQLIGMESRKPDQLSGGQRQRVALARALVRRPKVLLLDEPLGALDKTLREDMQQELRKLQQSVGITFILVTHDQEEALSMSDRIAVMSAGRILQIATPRDIYEKPNCTHVARFIGDMNFLSAVTEAVHERGRTSVAVDGFGKIDFVEKLTAESAGLTHNVAVRPEKIRLSNEQTNSDVCVSGVVVSSSYWGDQSQYQVVIDDCEVTLTVAAHNSSDSLNNPLHSGDRVWVSANHSAFIRFSGDSSA